MENFVVSSTNPNDATGGKGCLCIDKEHPDCKPPYVVFNGPLLDSINSPRPVACQNCIKQALKRMEDTPELLVLSNPTDSRPNIGEVTPESIDEVGKILAENWLPEPGEDYVPPNLAENLGPALEEPVAAEMTAEEYFRYRQDQKGKPTHADQVPSI